MKIESSLRATILSAHRAQSYQNTRENRQAAEKAAIDDLIKANPIFRTKTKQLVSKVELQRALDNEIYELATELGVSHEVDSITDDKAFKNNGGKIPQRKQQWSFDTVIHQLAGESPAEAAKTLKKLGINWH